ncbi:hypothetical protein P43SY_000641 [Pythium insidiosum]|uniref:COMM domain-containing protein n=1 Tax=Pythium insidiosum TaxID=114742 RepID=A0AAD5Q819_PYTIN|nr:hypothetical protein P43SY_000641 [Pythium insidiosum]
MTSRVCEFDWSLRLTLASNALCEQSAPSVALKLHLCDPDGSARQARDAGAVSACLVMMELKEEQLEKMLAHFAMIHKELLAR